MTAQNFLAGAAGLALGIAFTRGFARQRSGRIGKFWVDVTRSILWILLPLSVVGSLLLKWQDGSQPMTMTYDGADRLLVIQQGAQLTRLVAGVGLGDDA